MLEIKEVKTRKQQKEFLEFPLRLYRGNPYFVPPIYADEKKIFDEDYPYYETCEAVFYLAYINGKVAGRISGILQKASNELRNEKRVRFTRFDAINNRKVARALFNAVEYWAREKGMDTICGPLGYSDMEREGLLVEGFDQLSTFEEQYNADYYQDLIESLGYEKEVDWIESKLYPPEDGGAELKELSDLVMHRYRLHFGTADTTQELLDRYSDEFFGLVDKAYQNVYGAVPLTEKVRKKTMDDLSLIIDRKHLAVILDQEEKLVCLGICFPSIAKAVQKSYGHITPMALKRLVRDIRHPKILELGLIAVSEEYLNKGVAAVVASEVVHMLQEDGVEYAETNLNLEDNYAIRNLWKRFRTEQHKRRRAYVKKLES